MKKVMKKVMAQAATIDHGAGTISIDGVVLPWYLSSEGPQVVEHDPLDFPILIVNVPVFIESAVTVITGNGQRGEVFDPVLGNVRLWAIRTVREQFRAAYPDLELPE